jgi:hypothetical protein
MTVTIGRRELLVALGGAAAAWPFAARAQQPTMPGVGFLRDATAAGSGFMVDGLRKGLAEAGFVEGRNLAIEYAWTDGQSDQELSPNLGDGRGQAAAACRTAVARFTAARVPGRGRRRA